MNAIDMDDSEDVGGAPAPATGARVSDVDEQLVPAADAVVLPGYYASVRATRSFELGQYVRVLRVEGHGAGAIVHYSTGHTATRRTRRAFSPILRRRRRARRPSTGACWR